MMTVRMDNLAAPSSRELVQRLYNKNIELENKHRKSVQARIPSDPNAWQQMRENYEAIILEDHVFSEQHDIEYALWQLHYRRIEELRAHFSAALASTGSTTSPVVKGPARPDRIAKIRSQFKTFLSEATGFYHDLILKIRSKYGLPLGNFSGEPENQTILAKDGKKSAEMKKGFLSCHRCLIYLGDLARYKGLYGEGDSRSRDYAAASSYYMQAAALWPSSGNPHHQLAILASYSGDDLVAIYRYFRSLAVDSPFTTARDNLIIAFEKNRQSHSLLPGDAKNSVKAVPVRMTGKGRGKGEAKVLSKDTKPEVNSKKEKTTTVHETLKAFCIRFVRLNGVLFTRTSLETFGEVFSSVTSDLLELLSSGPEEELNFGSDTVENGLFIVRLVAILIFTVHNVNRDVEGQSYAEILQRSVLLQNAFTAAFEFMGHILKRCVLLQDPSSSYLLPGILVFVEWLACRPDIAAGNDAEEKQAAARSLFWNECISFLNKLMLNKLVSVDDDKDETCFFNMSMYEEGETGNRLALWEDFELRGFLPILPAQMILDFSRKHSIGSDGGNKERKARVQRIIAAGRALANVVQIDQQGIYLDQKLKKFAIGVEPRMSEDFMLSSSDITMSNGMTPDTPVDEKLHLGIVQPETQYVEEEEDEVIVFKPTVAEKPASMVAPQWPMYEILEPTENSLRGEWSSYLDSVAAPPKSVSLQSALESSSRPPASFAKIVPQHMQTINTSASQWLTEEHDSLANGVMNLSFAGNVPVPKPDMQGAFGAVQSHAPSLTLPPVNTTAGSTFSGLTKAPEAEIPSKFDSIMLSGATADSFMVRPLSTLPPNSRKNPVSRPVRHFGPPPGFSPFPSKHFDEPMAGLDLKNENSLVDDYSWLDGYQLSSSTKGITQNSMNHMTSLTPHLMSSSGLTGAMNFPFPGKQAPNVQVQVENQKIWQEYQLQEQLKLYQGQQHQQLQHGNQQFTPLPEEYQGQSLWTGRFFV
ncbi:hypothetical protein NE237_003470 [Protea cynaroides]|uniref:Protein SMG7 n=1 Tax=Protea cynaroides TaxID=273540 RepID=A0A9Q0KHH3_9MAGN|nr:hypothetical protein NE237_003470 [Protea cynaroides]